MSETDLHHMLASYLAGYCPQGILADFLEDGGDGRADRVREMKAEPAHPKPQESAALQAALRTMLGLPETLMGHPVLVEDGNPPVVFVPPCGEPPWMKLACGCALGLAINAPYYRVELRRQHFRHVRNGKGLPNPDGFETIWVGRCENCHKVYWSWDRWPRPIDVKRGEEALRRKVVGLFPEYQSQGARSVGTPLEG